MNETTTRLAELRAVAEQATPGPWAWCGHDDGLVELRGPGHFGPLDARLISASSSEPCFTEIIDPDEDLDSLIPSTSFGPTIHVCDPCKAVWRRHLAGEHDVFEGYRCPKDYALDTVWVNEPSHGHIVPINRFVARKYEHRHDIEPGAVDHPNARFIQTFNPAVVLALLDRLAAYETEEGAA